MVRLPLRERHFRARTALIMELIALRHQVAVLQRNRTRRPCIRASDRLLWVLLSRWWHGWRDSLIIVSATEANDLSRTLAKQFGRMGSDEENK